jgi:hypothetical protein
MATCDRFDLLILGSDQGDKLPPWDSARTGKHVAV